MLRLNRQLANFLFFFFLRMFFLASNRGSIKKRKNYREKDKEENYDREGGGVVS